MQFPPCKESLRDNFGCSCYDFPEVITMRDIGKNIRDLRQLKNMTQDTLAEKLYVTRQTVSNYETGRTRPDVDMVIKIAEVLETDANTILYGIPAPPERKTDLRKLLIAACALVVLIPLHSWVGNITEWYRQTWYVVWPKLLLGIFLTPPLFLLMGWTLMQTLGTFTKLSPVVNHASRWVRRLMYVAGVLYLAILIPYVLGIWFPGDVYELWQKLVFTFLGTWPVTFLLPDRSVVFFFCGILLWLFRSPKVQKETA